MPEKGRATGLSKEGNAQEEQLQQGSVAAGTGGGRPWQGQALGTPVIGADIGGIPELIAQGRTGEVFESGNAEALQEKIENLWKDKEKRKAYSENCLTYDFDNCEEYCKKLLVCYRKLLGKEKGAVFV